MIKAEFYTARTREPVVYRGNPFQIEVALAYGGELKEKQDAEIILMRLANYVPLLYQASSCAITKAVTKTNWRRYGLEQSGGKGMPHGPMLLLVHMASTWVPFTSESKEAIANYPEIMKEIKLAIQDCGRDLLRYIRKQARARRESRRLDIFQKYLPLVIENAEILAESKKKHNIEPILEKVVNADLIEEEEEEEIVGGENEEE